MEFSGRLAAIDNVTTVRDWRVSIDSDVQNFVASNTKGMQGTVKGNRDWNGSFNCYGHTPPIAFKPGEEVAFLGSYDGAKGLSGQILIDSIEITIDIEAGSIIGYTVNFSGNGAPDIDADAVVTDATMPDVYSSSQNCKVEAADLPAISEYSEVEHLRTVTITISADNVSYVDSSTGGWTKRKKGNLSCEISLTFYAEDNDLSNATELYPNTLKKIHIHVDDGEYWELDCIIFSNLSDILLDREAAAMVGFSIDGSFTAYYDDGTEMVEGSITDPADNEWWPND